MVPVVSEEPDVMYLDSRAFFFGRTLENACSQRAGEYLGKYGENVDIHLFILPRTFSQANSFKNNAFRVLTNLNNVLQW